MPALSIKIEGAEVLASRLKALPAKVSKGIARKALRAGAKIVLAAAKSNAPVKSGQLKRSLKVRAGKRKKNRISFLVSTREGDFKGDQFYGAFQELGWKSGKRGSRNRHQVEGKHYLRQAYQQTASTAATTVTEQLKAGIEAAAGESA